MGDKMMSLTNIYICMVSNWLVEITDGMLVNQGSLSCCHLKTWVAKGRVLDSEMGMWRERFGGKMVNQVGQ